MKIWSEIKQELKFYIYIHARRVQLSLSLYSHRQWGGGEICGEACDGGNDNDGNNSGDETWSKLVMMVMLMTMVNNVGVVIWPTSFG